MPLESLRNSATVLLNKLVQTLQQRDVNLEKVKEEEQLVPQGDSTSRVGSFEEGRDEMNRNRSQPVSVSC